MNKNLKIGLIVLVIAVAAYFAWQWWKNRQTSDSLQSPTQSFGTNLNSVAPELVGGSAGPSVGSAPAVSLPVNITLTEPTHKSVELGANPIPQAIPTPRSDKRVMAQRHAASMTSGPSDSIPDMEDSQGSRGMSDAEQDNVDQMDASEVDTNA
jgi:hypothetical protein